MRALAASNAKLSSGCSRRSNVSVKAVLLPEMLLALRKRKKKRQLKQSIPKRLLSHQARMRRSSE